MEIRHKQVQDMSPIEYRACYAANYGATGYMQEELALARIGYSEGQVIMLWNGPDTTARSLIGWALLTPVTRHGHLAVSDWVMKRSKYTVQFWVKRHHRLKGHGKTLMNQVKELDGNPHVMPHNEASAALFAKYKVQVLKIDKEIVKARMKPKVS